MPKYIYMLISDDEYELPTLLADSASELARMCGVDPATVKTSIYRSEKLGCFSRYVRVPTDEK